MTGVSNAANDEPVRLHDEDRSVETLHHEKIVGGPDIIGGWPYEFRFERELERELRRARVARLMREVPGFASRDVEHGMPRSPLRTALTGLYNPRGAQCHEYRILFAIANGHTDPETVRALIGGCRISFFEAAAMRAFGLVYDRASEGFTK